MKILELHILEFGGLSNRHFILSDGLNVFEGENEAGKSTVWLFIKFMLYGMPRKGHEERDRSVSWRTHRASGSMCVSYKGKEYRIERTFTESGRMGNDKLSIYHQSGEIAFPGKEAGEVFLGVPREVFESTCGIGQMQLANLGEKKGADAIRNLLSGADETVDISHIEAKLDKIRVQYRHKNGKGGRLGDLGIELNEAKKRLERAQETEKNVALLEEKMQRNQVQSAQSEEKLARVSERLTQLGTLEILRRFERLRSMEGQERILDEELGALRQREQKTDRALCEVDAAELRTLADHLRTAMARRDAQNEQKDRLSAQKSYDEADAEVGEKIEREGGVLSVLKKMKKLSRRTGIGFGVGGAAIGVGAVGFFLHPLVLLGAVLVGVTLCVVGVIAGVKRKKLASNFGQTPKTLEAYLTRCTMAMDVKREMLRERTAMEAALSATETLVREITEQLRTALLRTLPEAEVIPTAAAAEMEMTRISSFLREQNGLMEKKAVLVQSIKNEREGLSQYDEAALKEGLTIDPSELAGLDPVRLESERRFLKMQVQTLADSFRISQIELISAKANAETPMELSDHVETLSAEYKRADEYYQTLEMTLGALSSAAETMSGNVTPVLGRRAGEMMSYISAGKYETLTAGNDYTPSLLDESYLTVTADLLSAGTRDAAYLSIRIALAMQLFEEELPPLMLDDALCQIDDKRIVRILTLLSRLGEQDLQCLLFTCHEREALVCEREKLPYAKHLL